MKISIVIATKNARKTLERCVESVLSQTWVEKELIVVDGGSTDGTLEILERNSSRIAYWKSEPDTGIYNAWNKGLAHVSGDWICFLGADDYFWGQDVLERCMAAANRVFPQIRVIYGQVALVDDVGKVLKKIGAPWDRERLRFRQLSCLPHPGLLCHRNMFVEYGPFNESFRIAGDYEFLLRELLNRDACFIPNLITVGMQTGGISARTRTIRLGYEECRRAQWMHGLYVPGPRWLMGYAFALARWLLAEVVGERRVDQWVASLRRARYRF